MILEDLLGSDDVPRPQGVPLSAGTKNLMNQQISRSSISNDDIAKQNLTGSSDIANQTYSGALDDQKQRGGLMDPSLISAIKSKYGSMLGQKLTSLSNQTGLNTYQDRADRLKTAQNAMVAQQQVENQNYQRLITAMNNENELRSGVLKSWMGLGGTIAGTLLAGSGGGAAGRILGGQIGGKVASGLSGGGGGGLTSVGGGGSPYEGLGK